MFKLQLQPGHQHTAALGPAELQALHAGCCSPVIKMHHQPVILTLNEKINQNYLTLIGGFYTAWWDVIPWFGAKKQRSHQLL